MNVYKDLAKWGTESASLAKQSSDSVDLLGYGNIISDTIVQINSNGDYVVDLAPGLLCVEKNSKLVYIGQIGVVVTPTKKRYLSLIYK